MLSHQEKLRDAGLGEGFAQTQVGCLQGATQQVYVRGISAWVCTCLWFWEESV